MRNNNRVQYLTDAVGRIIEARNPDGTVETFRYDFNGNLIGGEPEAEIRHFDAPGQVIRIEHNELDHAELRQYDEQGRLIVIEHPDGRAQHFQYNLPEVLNVGIFFNPGNNNPARNNDFDDQEYRDGPVR